MTDDLSEWERGFLAGVAFRETFGFSGPTSVREIARRAYRDPDALVADVEIPGGLRFTTDDIVPTEGPGVAPDTADAVDTAEGEADPVEGEGDPLEGEADLVEGESDPADGEDGEDGPADGNGPG
jgi:hypothetical protein